MKLLRVVFRQYRWPFLSVMLLSLLSAVLGIGLIGFINQRLIGTTSFSFAVLPEFLVLLLMLLVVTLSAQLALTILGHHFVYRLRSEFIKRILDTPVAGIESSGRAALLAGLTNDVRNMTLAFARLPELIQGAILTLGSAAYLAWLSPIMMIVTACWVSVTVWGGVVLVTRAYQHVSALRETEDSLYQDYQTVLEGHKSLVLNRDRAAWVYNQQYRSNIGRYRHHIVRADTFHLSAINWSNIMMLGAIGLVFWMANSHGWASNAVAATYSLTLLFLRTPLLSAIRALPALLTAQVALNKLSTFKLSPWQPGFDPIDNFAHWQRLELRNVHFHYADNSFQVGPINLTIKRGEQLFLIGGNGSGKSTLALLLSGLYAPDTGELLVDGIPIKASQINAWRGLFSAIFTDATLFHQLLGPQGNVASQGLIETWLAKLQMTDKLTFKGNQIASLNLSKGQKKRVALLLAIAEERDILLLDEWAADQDPHFRREFYQVLLPALQQMGKTVFAISHDDHYFSHADRLLEMRQGKLSELQGVKRNVASRDAVACTE